MRGVRSYMASDYGDAMADVYDEWYPGTDSAAAVETLLALAEGGRVLELGAGTGRLAIPLAARGLEVHALDASARMLERLRAKPGGQAVVAHQGDMAGELPDGPFSLVFVAVNTLFAVTSAGGQQAVFAHVADRLTERGSFAVEAFVPHLRDDGDHVDVRELGPDRVVLSINRTDASAQTAFGQFVEISESGGVRLRPWSIRWSTVAELDAMASSAGLAVAARWSDWSRAPFGDDSDNHVTIFTRARHGASRVVT
jgi:SAM-dependent methyltransferase